MSSQTQPQNVHVALSIIERVIIGPRVAEYAKNQPIRMQSEFLRIQLLLSVSSHLLPSEPDGGTVNTQPRARPWKLPRTRRGIKRPASISVHAATSSESPLTVK